MHKLSYFVLIYLVLSAVECKEVEDTPGEPNKCQNRKKNFQPWLWFESEFSDSLSFSTAVYFNTQNQFLQILNF